MIRALPFAAALILALLSACTTAPTAPSDGSAVPPSQRPNVRKAAAGAPVFDWTAERSRMGTALTRLPGIQVSIPEDGSLRIVIPGADAFARDDATPHPSLLAILDTVVPALGTTDDTEIFVLGHTDSMGSELYNLQLSARRAEAVMEYLRTRGIALTRLHADGRGEAEPIANNGTPEGRAANRRVEIRVRPLE